MSESVEPEYLRLNRALWDARAPVHAASRSYGIDAFLADPEHLSDVVRFDRERLGDVAGLEAVHLQCHIGTDTLSLHRLGARMTGLDFSATSLEQARRLAESAGAGIRYVESDVYRAAEALPPGGFDLVYTGIGAIGWLPRVDLWAEQVAALLRPGGRLFFREGHPLMWTLDEDDPTALRVRYGYFEHETPLVFENSDTYVETDVELPTLVTHEWNHGVADVIGALLAAGLELTAIEEHDSVPWLALPGNMYPEPGPDGEYRLLPDRPAIPLSWTLQAVKR